MTPFFSFENNLFLEEYFGRDKDGYKRYCFDFVGNLLIRSKKCSFFGKCDVLCFLETPVLRFALLPYYRRFLDHGKVFM